jgi:hypothetical protein
MFAEETGADKNIGLWLRQWIKTFYRILGSMHDITLFKKYESDGIISFARG